MGKLLASLEAEGLDDDTIVIFVGDNGTGGDGKGTATELGARPVHRPRPGRKAESCPRALGDVTDILPTLAEFAGAELPGGHVIDGQSLGPVLRGETEGHRDWIYAHYEVGRVLRDAHWLLEVAAGGAQERFFHCGESRDGTGYMDVTASIDPEVQTARRRFAAILASMPEPKPRTRAENNPQIR